MNSRTKDRRFWRRLVRSRIPRRSVVFLFEDWFWTHEFASTRCLFLSPNSTWSDLACRIGCRRSHRVTSWLFSGDPQVTLLYWFIEEPNKLVINESDTGFFSESMCKKMFFRRQLHRMHGTYGCFFFSKEWFCTHTAKVASVWPSAS